MCPSGGYHPPEPSLSTRALVYLDLRPSVASAPAHWREEGGAKQAGRGEVATCCHGSEPTYQSLHQVCLTGPRCLVAGRESVAQCSEVAAVAGSSWEPEPPDPAISVGRLSSRVPQFPQVESVC